MTAKPTPGPWRLDGAIHADLVAPGYHIIDSGRGFPEDNSFGPGFSISGCMSLADAQLIAAAPELLEACKMLVAAYSERPGDEHGLYALSELRLARLGAAAAIAKAEGRS